MTTPLGFDDLKGILPRRIAPLPDHRQAGPNTRSRIQDAALGAFGVFFTPSPSFLESQRHLQHSTGHNNAWTLLGVETIPCHHQRRHLLAPIMPRALDRGYLEVCEGLAQHGVLRRLRVLAEQRLLALDGTQYCSSNTLHCRHCLQRQPAQGPTLSYHRASTPVIVCPGRSEVIALPPACIMPQDGHDTQDGERVAGKRWRDTHAKHVAPDGVTVLGDDLYRNQPLGQLALQQGVNFLCVCQPDAHPTLDERWAFWQANTAIKALETRRQNGRFTAITRYR